MSQNQKQVNINFNLDPNKTPIMYADSYLVTSNEHVMTFNFAQALLDPTQQNIVARVALTSAQAKDFLKNLNDHIGKYEV